MTKQQWIVLGYTEEVECAGPFPNRSLAWDYMVLHGWPLESRWIVPLTPVDDYLAQMEHITSLSA